MAKILVVDDDPLLLDLLLETLQTIGYDPTGASGGAEALELLGQEIFELVVSDIKMPGMSGIDLGRQVRQTYPNIPIIFITGVYDPEHLQQFKPDGFLAKPFRINQIEQLIESTLSITETAAGTFPAEGILVVDDDDSFRLMLIEALKLFGYRPYGAADSADAMRLIGHNKFSVVVTDIKLSPNDGSGAGDGRILAREIKKNWPEIRTVLITAYLQSDLKVEISQSENEVADAVLLKPFKIEELIDILERLSSERKMVLTQNSD